MTLPSPVPNCIDLQQIQSPTPLPAPGTLRLYADLTSGQIKAINSAGANPLPGSVRSINFVIDGSGSVPGTGVYGQISIPFACTLTGWVLTADQSGSAVIDVLRSTFAAFPTTVSIAGTDKPTLSAVQKNQNLGPLSLWGSVAINAGDQLQINLNSVATVTRLNLTLNITVP
jgi:hypothetical protein